MTRMQTGTVVSLLLVAMMLGVLLSVFVARKDVIAAEGADLRTGESIWVTATLSELRARSDEFASGTRAFTTLEPGTRAVAFLSGGWETVPLHSGVPLSGAAGEAIAGARRAPGAEVLRVNGTSYEIVGRIGLRPESLLAEEAVIADRSLFADERERLRLDGPAAAERFRSAFPGRSVEVVREGVNRRTNVDVVTPFVALAGLAAALIVSLCAVVSGVRSECDAARVRYLAGRQRSRLVVAIIVRVTVLTGGCAAVASGLGAFVGRSLYVMPDLVLPVAGVAVVVIGTTSVGALLRSRRWS